MNGLLLSGPFRQIVFRQYDLIACIFLAYLTAVNGQTGPPGSLLLEWTSNSVSQLYFRNI